MSPLTPVSGTAFLIELRPGLRPRLPECPELDEPLASYAANVKQPENQFEYLREEKKTTTG